MLEQILESVKLFQPEIVLMAVLCLAIILDLFFRNKPNIIALFVILGLLVAGYLVLKQTNGLEASIFSGMFVVDPFSVFFKCLIILSALFIVIFSIQSKELNTGKRRMGEFYTMLTAISLGMLLMTGASNLLMMYLALELTSLTSYILVGYKKDVPNSSEASLKFVIYGSLSSALMLYGISIIYGLTGSLSIFGINEALSVGGVNLLALIIANVLLIVGFGYKISAVPFHFWAPDVYEGAPITITAFLSVASKAAGFAMMMRYFFVTYFNAAARTIDGHFATLPGLDWTYIIAIMSVLTMTLGNLVAIWQNNLKRLLAYSSIAHAGYMLLGIVVLNNEGISAILIYFVVYLFMNLGAFYVVMLIANKIGSEDIEDYKGLGYRTPFLAVALSIFLISLTGLPPTAGFIGKLYIFAALINAEWIGLAIIGVLNSVISLYYYVRVFKNMFLKDPEKDNTPISYKPAYIFVTLLLLVPTILFGLYFSPIVEVAQASVKMLGLM